MMMSVMVLFLSRDLVSDTQAQGQGKIGADRRIAARLSPMRSSRPPARPIAARWSATCEIAVVNVVGFAQPFSTGFHGGGLDAPIDQAAYGATAQRMEELAALQPDLLVTVDHGIACHAGVIAAPCSRVMSRAVICWRTSANMSAIEGPRMPVPLNSYYTSQLSSNNSRNMLLERSVQRSSP